VKILFVSNLFPDASKPIWGLDNATILHYLRAHHEVKVLATRFVPLWSRRASCLLPRTLDKDLEPSFLSIPYLPKVDRGLSPFLYRKSLRRTLDALHRRYPFDRILCSWLYPDGCAVEHLARSLQKPFALIAQGSDVHQYLSLPYRRRHIVTAANHSLGVITRSGDLGTRLRAAGVHENIPRTVYNGVDHQTFFPDNPEDTRQRLGLPRGVPIILYVGNLLPIKRPQLIIEAFEKMAQEPDYKGAQLLLIGGGPLKPLLEQQIKAANCANQIHLLGQKPPKEIADYMRAASFLTLASINEGVPNVILEALASGLPVVAPDVGGIAEVLNRPELGITREIAGSDNLLEAWKSLLNKPRDTTLIASTGKQYTWEAAAEAYSQVLSADPPLPFR
jgi:teichuronic acid biosynthesis glycosyltransferase TuaC